MQNIDKILVYFSIMWYNCFVLCIFKLFFKGEKFMDKQKKQEKMRKFMKYVDKHNKKYEGKVDFNYDELEILLDGIDISDAELNAWVGGRSGIDSILSIKVNDKEIIYGDFFMYREIPNGNLNRYLFFPYPPVLSVIDYSKSSAGAIVTNVPDVAALHSDKEYAAVCNKIIHMGIDRVLAQKTIELTDEDMKYYNLSRTNVEQTGKSKRK